MLNIIFEKLANQSRAFPVKMPFLWFFTENFMGEDIKSFS
jgi:hypothetical protein